LAQLLTVPLAPAAKTRKERAVIQLLRYTLACTGVAKLANETAVQQVIQGVYGASMCPFEACRSK
jgi:hypothetical protein